VVMVILLLLLLARCAFMASAVFPDPPRSHRRGGGAYTPHPSVPTGHQATSLVKLSHPVPYLDHIVSPGFLDHDATGLVFPDFRRQHGGHMRLVVGKETQQQMGSCGLW